MRALTVCGALPRRSYGEKSERQGFQNEIGFGDARWAKKEILQLASGGRHFSLCCAPAGHVFYFLRTCITGWNLF
jgi:hypothetical protein